MGYGMYGAYNCDATQLHCNNIKNYFEGIRCFKLTLSEQGDPGLRSWKNEWNGSMLGQYRISGDPALPIKWDYESGNQFEPFPFSININPIHVFQGIPDCLTPTSSSQGPEREQYHGQRAGWRWRGGQPGRERQLHIDSGRQRWRR